MTSSPLNVLNLSLTPFLSLEGARHVYSSMMNEYVNRPFKGRIHEQYGKAVIENVDFSAQRATIATMIPAGVRKLALTDHVLGCNTELLICVKGIFQY